MKEKWIFFFPKNERGNPCPSVDIKKKMSLLNEIDKENLSVEQQRHLSCILDSGTTVEVENILELLKTLDFVSLKSIPHHVLRVVETMDIEHFETEFSDKTWVYKEVVEFRAWT